MGVNVNGVGEFESSYPLFNTFIKVMDQWTTIKSPGFCQPPYSLTMIPLFFLTILLKVLRKHASKDVLPAPPVVSQAVSGLWLMSQQCQQAQSPQMAEVRMSQHPQTTGTSNPQCQYRRWALKLWGSVAPPSALLSQAGPGGTPKCPGRCCTHVSHGTWHLYPLHEAAQAGMPPPLSHTNTLH